MSLKSRIDVVLHFFESIKVKTECNLLTKRVGHERDHEKLKLSPISYIRAWELYNHTPLKKKKIFLKILTFGFQGRYILGKLTLKTYNLIVKSSKFDFWTTAIFSSFYFPCGC